MALIGKIVAITGNALLISNNGDQRELRLGDSIQTADTIKTPAGVEVELELANGRIVHIGAEQLVAFADELGDVFVPEASDSAIDVATIDTVIKAIEEGKDINEVLEDTAAGVGGTSNSYGFGFVDLLRINDDLNNFRFVFDSSTTGRLEAEPAVAVATGTIVDDDGMPTVSIAPASATEGSPVNFTVSLSGLSATPTTVTFTTTTGTAGAADFTSTTTTVTIPAGTLSVDVPVATAGDAIYEGNETFTATLSAPVGATLGTAVATGTIVDDDGMPTVSIAPASATEGSPVNFTVSLSGLSATPTTVTFTTTTGTAGAADFTSTTTTVTIPAGTLSVDVPVATAGDAIYEGNETFTATLSAPVGATLGTAVATGTIVDDDGMPTVSIAPASATEGTNLVHTVTLSNASSTTTSFAYSLTGTTATAGLDFNTTPTFSNGVTLSGGNLIVPAGVTSFTISIPTLDDALNEASETTSLSVGGVTAVGTITDNDAQPSLSINDISVNEAAGTATFIVTLSAASGQTVTVGYNTSNGTATAGSDYTGVAGTVTFTPGQITQTITVPITNDTLRETSETFYVNLVSPTNATVADALGVGVIVDNDPIPSISSITAATENEGNALVHTVTLSNLSSVATNFSYTLGGGTAISGTDYNAMPIFSNGVTLSGGFLTVPAGVGSFTVTVPSIQDAIDEGVSETYNLAVGGVTAVGTIIDDDASPTLSVSNISVAEVDNLNAVFNVSLSSPSSTPVTVNLAFVNGTATGGTNTGNTSTTDFGNSTRMQVSTDGGVTWSALGVNTATFAAGATSILVRTYINANTGGTELASETFDLNATVTAGATSNVTATGTATIIDETITVGNSTVNEGVNLVYAVTVSAHATDITTSLTLSGTASPTDYGALTFSNGVTYNSTTGLITIPANVTSFNVTLPTVNDTLDETNETVLLTIGGVTGTGTINDNDATPSLTINDVTVNEAAGTATFTVTLSAASGQNVSVNYNTSSVTALSGIDFSAASGTLSFAPGEITKTITVNIANDTAAPVYEGAETFRVNLTTPVNATIADNFGVGTIVDNGTGAGGTDNDTPTFTVSNVTVSDQAAGFATFVVSLSNASSVATVFNLALTNGTATGAGVDYGAAGATNLQVSTDNGATWANATVATIAANATYVLVRTPITPDFVTEVSETFTLTATRTSGVTSNVSFVGTATITDANNAPDAINDVPVSGLVEDGAVTVLAGNAILGGSGNMPDADPNNDTLSITGAVAGTGAVVGAVTLATPLVVSGIYGTLQIAANGTYTYTLDNARIQTQNLINGQVANDIFTYKITDGNGGFDTATITVAVTGTLDLTAITPQPVAIATDGLTGEYYGYNDRIVTGNRVHADDRTATSLGTATNLESVEDIELIINGRNVAMGGPANLVGTANAAAADAADVKFTVRTLDYGLSPQVDGDLGANASQAAGSILLPQDNVNTSATRALANFLDQDSSTAVIQTGTPTGAIVGTETGLGKTTDAIIRMTGFVYLERGNYDFRVYADDGFRLKVGGETLIEFDGNQAPTTRTFNNVEVSDLISGLTSIELLYWEQGGNAVLQFEFKPSSSASWVPFSLDSIAFFSTTNAPALTDTRIQDIVETSVNQQYELRTGSVLDGDNNTNTLTGSAGRDYIQGFGGNDILNGFGGADYLDGGDGNDTLNGGEGNDILIGGTGNDTMTGGLGDDIYRIDSATDVTIEVAGEGTDTIEIEATYNPGTYTVATNFENVLLNGSFNTNVIGNASANRITGNDGDNTLSGLAGDDRLIGGKGNDTLTGGANNDIFEWNLADKGSAGSPAIDTITDFVYSAGKTDSLDLRDLLVGEASTELNTNATPNIGNLLDYLNVTVSGGTTTINVSSTGGFTGGAYAPSAEDQRIVLTGVDLYSATGSTAGNETQLLQALLKNGTLIVD
ncbi:MAG: retention module-containing protein [Methylotenera sp.]|nr:retention module-containing protein [Methylotenera sp.]